MTTSLSEEKTRSLGKTATTKDSELQEPPWLIPLKLARDFGLSLFRPFAPQVIPLAVFVLTVPVLVLFAVSAGWLVWRSIAVGWETPLHLQYGDGIAPYAQVQLPPLVSQQPYDISLHLVVPASQSNYELGNFMTTLTLSTPSNRTITSVRRPALVLPSLVTPLSLVWGQTATVRLAIPLISSIEPGTSAVVAQVELGRRDQWKSIGRGEGRELSVSSAVLRGVVVHRGFRGLLTRFPLLTALAASGTFLFISFIILATCLLPMIEWRTHDEAETVEGVTEKPARPTKREESVPRRARRSRSVTAPRRRSRSQTGVKVEEIKTEETVTAIPAASSSTQSPLRRRRSRLSQSGSE